MSSPSPCVGICAYKQLNMQLGRDEPCVLIDNSQREKWTIQNSKGNQFSRRSFTRSHGMQLCCNVHSPFYPELRRGVKKLFRYAFVPLGQKGSVPAVCLLIPPPNPQAEEAAENIVDRYDKLKIEWKQKHLDVSTVNMRKGVIDGTSHGWMDWVI